jgi:hypothetical protein
MKLAHPNLLLTLNINVLCKTTLRVMFVHVYATYIIWLPDDR